MIVLLNLNALDQHTSNQADSPQGQTVHTKKMAKKPTAISQILQAWC